MRTLLVFPALLFALQLALGPAGAEQNTPRKALAKAIEALDNNKIHDALVASHMATLMLTQRDKFHIRRTVLTEGKAGGWGLYKKRARNIYKPGEAIILYLEPGAFKYARQKEWFNFGFTVDFRLTQPNGNIVGGQDNFDKFTFQSLRPNTEVLLTLTLSLTGVPAGKYVLKIAVHDMVSKEVATTDVPVEYSGS